MVNQPHDPNDAAKRTTTPTHHDPASEGARPVQTPSPTRDTGSQKAHETKDDESIHQGDQEDMARRQGEHPASVVAPSDPDVIRGRPSEEDRDDGHPKQAPSSTDEEE